ncbi:hypothetical protein ACWG0P_13985 [Amedibacillus sp. YH-ame6]
MKLQGVYGDRQSIKASQLKVNNIMLWNYGYKEKILNIEETKSGKSLKLKILCVESNKTLTRVLRKESLVCLA